MSKQNYYYDCNLFLRIFCGQHFKPTDIRVFMQWDILKLNKQQIFTIISLDGYQHGVFAKIP